MTVQKRGSGYVLVSRTGKVLGRHRTRAKAHAQEAAIQHSKRRRKK